MSAVATLHPTAAAPRLPARLWHVLPLAFVTYSLAYLDRVNIGFAGAGRMAKTLNFSEIRFNWFNSVFFIGYVLFQIPGAGYAARHSVRWLMGWTLLLWGIIASLTAFLTNFRLLLLDRFLLGAVEGLVFPSLLVFLTHWFTRGERSRANTIMILGNPLTLLWGSLASGNLIDYFDAHPVHHMQGWQVMLLAEGAPTILWALIWSVLARDRPKDAAWLGPGDAAAVEATLDAEQAGVKQVKNYWAAFKDRQVILLCLQFFAWSLGIYGLNMWLPVIMKTGTSLGLTRVGLLNAVPYFFGMVAMLAVAALSDRLLVRRAFVWPCLFLGAAAFLLSYLVGVNHFWISYFGLSLAATCMYAPYGPFWAMTPEFISRNVIGESLALINTGGAVGAFAGTYAVGYLHTVTHSYGASFGVLAFFLAASGAITLLLRPSAASLGGFEAVSPKGPPVAREN